MRRPYLFWAIAFAVEPVGAPDGVSTSKRGFPIPRLLRRQVHHGDRRHVCMLRAGGPHAAATAYDGIVRINENGRRAAALADAAVILLNSLGAVGV